MPERATEPLFNSEDGGYRFAIQDHHHALYVGWVLGIALKHGLHVVPSVDDNGDYTAELEVQTPKGALITVVVPPPPDDWRLTDDA
jgi:hypothetical protein